MSTLHLDAQDMHALHGNGLDENAVDARALATERDAWPHARSMRELEPQLPAIDTAVDSAAGSGAVSTAPRALLAALLDGSGLGEAVPAALALVERDPLASAGCFRGDVLRGLMEVPGRFWSRWPRLYTRYVSALRTGAHTRQRLPPRARMEFWSVLDRATLATEGGPTIPPLVPPLAGPSWRGDYRSTDDGFTEPQGFDEVDNASLGSFPASDPPAWNGARACRRPATRPARAATRR